MTRPQRWDMRLSDLMARSRKRAFQFGQHDCCTFALESAGVVLDLDMSDRITWSNEFEAASLVRAKGIRGLGVEWFGAPVENWRIARRGDICLIDAARGLAGVNEALGVCLGGSIACPGEFEMSYTSLKESLCVWPIG